LNALSKNEILTAEQKMLLKQFSTSALRDLYYLTGGTALAAFHLQHRYSEDLDLFTENEVPVEQVMAFVKSLPGLIHADYEHKFDRRIFLLRFEHQAAFKVEFTGYPFRRLEPGVVIDGVVIDSVRDIVANKLAAMTERRDAKDFADIYCAVNSKGLDLATLVRDAETKFGIRGIMQILQGRFLQPPPSTSTLRMRAPLPEDALREYFLQTARQWIAKSVDDAERADS